MKPKSFILSKDEIPRQWYNILADIKMNPPLGPDGQPISPDMLAPVFPMNLIEQEVSSDRWIDIPEPVLDVLSIWRPAPLTRATALEKALGTPAKIYYKNEGMSPPGSHKPNTAVPQAYYNKVFGIEKITTETGAGQWGSALSFACAQFGLTCKVYMVRISFDQKPYRKAMMETWGGKCIASPSNETKAGRDALERDPNTPGSLGIAISEAVEAAVSDTSGKTRYSLGSVLNHVMLHQTIIGLEAKKQFEMAGDYPDIVIGCAGGGSNFAGLAFPFVLDKMNGKQIEIYPVEPKACPTMTRAPFAYDHGDTAGYTPLLPMHSLGHNFVPAPIHAGGLALPRHGAHRQPADQRGVAHTQIGGSDGRLRGRCPVGADRGVHPRAGNLQCPGPGGGRSEDRQRRGQRENHRGQLQRTWPAGSGCLRQILLRRTVRLQPGRCRDREIYRNSQ